MADDPGPEPHARVRALLLGAIDSYEKLEIVLLLARAQEPIDVTALAAAARIRTSVAEEALAMLAQRDVVSEASPGSWSLAPAGRWSDAIAELADLHERERPAVMNLMTDTTLERLRQSSARAFADAFLLRKPKKGDHDG
jgi:hypothetical protein